MENFKTGEKVKFKCGGKPFVGTVVGVIGDYVIVSSSLNTDGKYYSFYHHNDIAVLAKEVTKVDEKIHPFPYDIGAEVFVSKGSFNAIGVISEISADGKSCKVYFRDIERKIDLSVEHVVCAYIGEVGTVKLTDYVYKKASVVLDAAKESPEAYSVLGKLFPRLFKTVEPFCKIGSVFKYPCGDSGIFIIVGGISSKKVHARNITKGTFGDACIEVSDLMDSSAKVLTIEEVRYLLHTKSLDGYKFNLV